MGRTLRHLPTKSVFIMPKRGSAYTRRQHYKPKSLDAIDRRKRLGEVEIESDKLLSELMPDFAYLDPSVKTVKDFANKYKQTIKSGELSMQPDLHIDGWLWGKLLDDKEMVKLAEQELLRIGVNLNKSNRPFMEAELGTRVPMMMLNKILKLYEAGKSSKLGSMFKSYEGAMGLFDEFVKGVRVTKTKRLMDVLKAAVANGTFYTEVLRQHVLNPNFTLNTFSRPFYSLIKNDMNPHNSAEALAKNIYSATQKLINKSPELKKKLENSMLWRGMYFPHGTGKNPKVRPFRLVSTSLSKKEAMRFGKFSEKAIKEEGKGLKEAKEEDIAGLDVVKNNAREFNAIKEHNKGGTSILFGFKLKDTKQVFAAPIDRETVKTTLKAFPNSYSAKAGTWEGLFMDVANSEKEVVVFI